MSLTGTSATVTALSASSCPTALASNTTYQLTANISCSGTAFTVTSTSNVDVNLNGYTITFGTGANNSFIGAFLTNGSANLVVHGGTITEGTGPNIGANSGSTAGPSAVGSTSDNGADYGTQMYNLNVTVHSNMAKVLYQDSGDAGGTGAVIFHDNIFADKDPTQCASVACRENDQYYAVALADNKSQSGTQFYNNFGTGGPQGALSTYAGNSVFQNNVMDPGSAAATNTNGFGYQSWGNAGTIQNNLVAGSGTGGSCTSCRGVQVSNVVQAVSNTVVQNNTIRTTALDNDAEYPNCDSAQEAYSYGMQLITAGASNTFTHNTFQGNKVVVTAGVCGGFGFSWSGTNQTGNVTQNNHLECDLAGAPVSLQACAGFRMDAKQYSYVDFGITSNHETILGDTSALHIWYDGTPSWTCSQCTFGHGTNPTSGWVFIDFYYGAGSGGGTNPLYFVDPTFLAGSESLTNLSTWTSNNRSLTSSYFIQFTQTVTVKGASSGNPISGATVTYTDALSNKYTGTTNSSGVATVIVNENQYAGTNGNFTITHYNNYSYTVTSSGCSSAGASGLTVTSPNSVTVSLPGC
jgi:hypothetical protein